MKTGDHVISDDVYGETYGLFLDVMTDFRLELTFLRMDNRKRIAEEIRPNISMLCLKIASNLLTNIVDVEMVVDIARRHKLLTVVDNTFAAPYFLQPVEYRIDLVVHSTTKYLNGHCDVVDGAVVTTTDELTQRLQFLNTMGTCASPFDCWLVLCGIEVLPVRMKQQRENPLAVVNYVKRHPQVNRELYPRVESHPGREIAKRQLKGFGGVVSLEPRGGIQGVNTFSNEAQGLFSDGIIGRHDFPCRASGYDESCSMPKDYRVKVGITDELVRLSVGLENVDHLTEDLEHALQSP